MSDNQTSENPRLKRLETGALRREAETVRAMIAIYCKARHHTDGQTLCPACRELADYAFKRLSCCPFGHDKPVCAKCKVHCYKPAYKEKIAEVMRFAGPRIVFKHPILALEHLWKSATVTPPEKPRAGPRAKSAAATPASCAPARDNDTTNQ